MGDINGVQDGGQQNGEAAAEIAKTQTQSSHGDGHASDHDPTTNTLRPAEDSVLTIRLIKSFTYRTTKNMVLQHVNLNTTTVANLKEQVQAGIKTTPAFKVYRVGTNMDTLKLYTKAHGAKTTNLIINLDHDEWILDDGEATLASLGIENETEISFFNRALYEAFKLDPEQKW